MRLQTACGERCYIATKSLSCKGVVTFVSFQMLSICLPRRREQQNLIRIVPVVRSCSAPSSLVSSESSHRLLAGSCLRPPLHLLHGRRVDDGCPVVATATVGCVQLNARRALLCAAQMRALLLHLLLDFREPRHTLTRLPRLNLSTLSDDDCILHFREAIDTHRFPPVPYGCEPDLLIAHDPHQRELVRILPTPAAALAATTG